MWWRRSRTSWITIRRARCEKPLWMLYVATVKRMGDEAGRARVRRARGTGAARYFFSASSSLRAAASSASCAWVTFG